MVGTGLVFTAIAGISGLILLRRLHSGRSALRRLAVAQGRPATFLAVLVERLSDWIDQDLLAETGPAGFAGMTLRFREFHDPAENVADLLRVIADNADGVSSADLLNLAKYVYQLQHSLGAPGSEFENCIQEISSRLRSIDHLGSQVAGVETVREGAAVDPKTMWPLNAGTRVRQPFGVVLYDASGNVLNKAKVLCR